MKKTILSIAAISLLAMSCGEDKKTANDNESQKVQVETDKETVSATDQNNNVIELSSNDDMKFDKSELKVKAGQKVTLTLKHVGKIDKSVMGHNFVLLKQGTDITEFANKAISAKDNDYIPEGDAVIAHTKVIGGGESTSISFDPPAIGTYDYICSFPGHSGMMKGKFIVE